MLKVLSEEEEAIGKAVVHAAYTVHRTLGLGLLESVYEACFCHELCKSGVAFARQVKLPVFYDNLKFEEGFRVDVWVQGLVICELKAVEELHPIHEAQLLTYLRLSQTRIGFVINFHVPLIKSGLRRFVLYPSPNHLRAPFFPFFLRGSISQPFS